LIICGRSDTGRKRINNEDSFFFSAEPVGIFDELMIVCDGMGGHSFGEVASSVCVQTLTDTIRETPDPSPVFVLEQAINSANLEVRKESDRLKSSGMGTTMVMAAIQENIAYIANIGDSRLYLLDKGAKTLRQVTRDHSLVEEQVAKGLLSRGSTLYASQKNVITRAIGVYSEPDPDFFEEELTEGNVLLLCSDGLTNMVPEDEILKILLNESFSLRQRVLLLIDAANRGGGTDNITVILAEVKEE